MVGVGMSYFYEAINPECRQNKCGNCDGRAMCNNPQCDGIHPCQHHCHSIKEASKR
jgi:hypothetical protein